MVFLPNYYGTSLQFLDFFVKDALLLIANEDISATLVGHIIGSFIAWPKFLVIYNDMMVNILSFSLFYLIKIFYWHFDFIIGGHKFEKNKREKESKWTIISLHTRKKTSPSSSNIARHTKSIRISRKSVMPTIIIIF